MAVFDVTNTNDAGVGSLRHAITAANASPGFDEIHFTIDEDGIPANDEGAKVIRPRSELPPISGPLRIDGYRQPGAVSNAEEHKNSARIRVVLDGTLGGFQSGLRAEAGADITGLSIINWSTGITLSKGRSWVVGNFIGVAPDGTAAGNKVGVTALGDGNQIGGDAPQYANVISGNLTSGIRLSGGGNQVEGNLIGVAPDASELRPNATGIDITGSGNTIGGESTDAGNVIGGNRLSGISIYSLFEVPRDNVVIANFIGVNKSRDAVPNGGDGVRIHEGYQNRIGVLAEPPNTIWYNHGNGVTVVRGTGNTIRFNSIHSNDKLGINLFPADPASGDFTSDDVTPNDPVPDGDGGANNLQNYPVLVSAEEGAFDGKLHVRGVIESLPDSKFEIDFYGTPTPDRAKGHGEGIEHVGTLQVRTDENGRREFEVALEDCKFPFISATATYTGDLPLFGGTNDTSEFSPVIANASSLIGPEDPFFWSEDPRDQRPFRIILPPEEEKGYKIRIVPRDATPEGRKAGEFRLPFKSTFPGTYQVEVRSRVYLPDGPGGTPGTLLWEQTQAVSGTGLGDKAVVFDAYDLELPDELVFSVSVVTTEGPPDREAGLYPLLSGRAAVGGVGELAYARNVASDGPWEQFEAGGDTVQLVITGPARPGAMYPGISDIAPVTAGVNEGINAIGFRVVGGAVPAEQLLVTAHSSNQQLLRDDQIFVEGTGPDRALLLVPTPDQRGEALVRLTVTNGSLSSSLVFRVSVGLVSELPGVAYVSSSTWSDAFKRDLARHGLGHAEWGVALATSRLDPTVLPWAGIDRISFEIGGGNNVTPELVGVPDGFIGFEFDPESRVATWTLPRPLGAGEVLPTLFVSSPEAVLGPVTARLGVLPADANGNAKVDPVDLREVRSRLSTSTAGAAASRGRYSPLHDFDGDGRIGAFDLQAVRKRLFSSLPAVPAQPTGQVIRVRQSASVARDILAPAARRKWSVFAVAPLIAPPELLEASDESVL